MAAFAFSFVISALALALHVSASSVQLLAPEDAPIKPCRRSADCGDWGFCVGRTMPFDHIAFCRCTRGTVWVSSAIVGWHCEPTAITLLRKHRSLVAVKSKGDRPLTMSRWFPQWVKGVKNFW